MIVFTVMAFSIIMWQSEDLSVDIVSKSDKDNKDNVVISVLNTAGSTLLFYESEQMTGKIEYLSEDGWVEFCDVCYTMGNTNAFSQQYGGSFAELEPGENWSVAVPDEKVSQMQDGTYRIKLTYITKDKYEKYLELAFQNREQDLSKTESDKSGDDVSSDKPESGFTEITEEGKVGEIEIKENFIAESESEVFIKQFQFTAVGKTTFISSNESITAAISE